MFSIRQIILTHRPMGSGLHVACWGCSPTVVPWTPEHVLAILEENGHDTNSLAK